MGTRAPAATIRLQLVHLTLTALVLCSGTNPLRAQQQSQDPISAAASLFNFQDADIKFSLAAMMAVLRDHQHEGWVLAAYPDPNTQRPLIGAGFSLDVEATDHPQTDPLNPNRFIEPSSAQLWRAAGLGPDRLHKILDRFDRDVHRLSPKTYRRKVLRHTLTPELTEEEATRLLRISAIQAIHNAKAYCRYFDRLSGSQQLALSQLVFQMGVNLEQFVQFRQAINGAINGEPIAGEYSGPQLIFATYGPIPDYLSQNPIAPNQWPSEYWTPEYWTPEYWTPEYWTNDQWTAIQRTLADSQWAVRYTTRAEAVIAMFDPDYSRDPQGAMRRVEAILPPPPKPVRKKKSAHTLRASAEGDRHSKPAGGKSSKQKRQAA